MNKPKLSAASVSRALLNAFLVLAMVVLASLIGVGGAALWIYSRPEAAKTAKASSRLKADVVANGDRSLPQLTPVQTDSDQPAQTVPARYMPTDTEVATLSDAPRYTYISYDGGRQQAHLRVNTVLSGATAPAPLDTAQTDVAAVAQGDERPPLSEPTSHYIYNAQGRVVGVDGTAGAAAEAQALRATVARAIPAQTTSATPEVRMASPVVVRKAAPVDGNFTTGSFDARAELSSDDEDRPVLRAIPVVRTTHQTHPAMFGASDENGGFGRY